VGHGNGGVYEALLHVPLLVRPPGGGEGTVVSEPASLTEFPRAVDSALEGDPATAEWFVPSDPVVAATDGIDPDTQERARQYLPDVDVLTTPADAVYTAADGEVRKEVRWGDCEATLVVHDAHAQWVVDDTTELLDPLVDGFEDAGVSTSADGVGSDVKQRLEDLGYA